MPSRNRLLRWALALPLMTWPGACSGSPKRPAPPVSHVQIVERIRYCLKGETRWPLPGGDLPPDRAADPGSIEGDSSAAYTARLLDELDAYHAWGAYVVAWCVRPAGAP